MSVLRISVALALVAMLAAGCSEASQQTEVRAVVAQHFSHEGLETGDPVPGATLRLYQGDTVVMETVLDEAGTALIGPDPGSYDVQISLDSTDPECLWGETVFGVAFPSSPLTLEVSHICAGQ
ncbi:MAG: carboxypeptidase-like regulatory domain-containing protein [Acidimicrobiia bacterium]